MGVLSTNTCLFLGMLACILLVGCRPRDQQPRDQHGRTPRDFAALFVNAVNSGNCELALSCWTPYGITNVELNSRTNAMAEFEDRWKCDTFWLSNEKWKKGNIYIVLFKGCIDGRSVKGKGMPFGLVLYSNSWRMYESHMMGNCGTKTIRDENGKRHMMQYDKDTGEIIREIPNQY